MSMTQVRKLVSKKELKTIHGIPYSFARIARLEKAGQFPKRVILGACRVA
jgi:prophage regulatory protein